MATPTSCYPWFHAIYEPYRAAAQVYVSSGCSVNGIGNVACEPEDMRADAEAKMRDGGYLDSVDLETYTLARYMQGEVGNGTIEERVAVGEAAVNRAKLEGKKSALDILLYRQQPGHPNYGYYGPIHGPGGTTTAPYGRWATSHVDPTVLTLLLANLVTSGESRNFSNGADDQDGLEYSANFPSVNGYVNLLASRNKFWVGLLPGVNHWRTFLQTTAKGETQNTAWGRARVEYTLGVLENDMNATGGRKMAEPWPLDLPLCPKPAGRGWLIATGLLGTIAGALAFSRGWLGRVGK